MSSVSAAQAKELSHCSVSDPRLDGLVTDQFLACPDLAVREIATECEKRAVIAAADIPTLSFIASGGVLNASPVTWSDPAADYTPRRIGSIVQVAGDIKDNVGQIRSVLDLQSRYLVSVIRQKLGQQMWALAPGANSPTGMPAFAAVNPNGVLDAAVKPVTPDLLGCLRAKITPWSPSSPLAYVMNTKTFAALEQSQRNQGVEPDYHRDERTGVVAPYFGSFPVLCCDWISLAEPGTPATTSVYLVRIGRGDDDPDGIEGVSLVVPAGKKEIQVSSFRPMTGDDLWQAQVYWDVAVDGGSRGAAIARAKNILSPS